MKLFPSSFKIPRLGKKVTPILISILVFIIVITIYNLEDRDIFKALRIFKAIEQKSLDRVEIIMSKNSAEVLSL